MNNLAFNPYPSRILHIDLNSCFASIEQQANPLLRGKSIAVAAYNTPNGCILASSTEAKKYGVKTGMKVKEGKFLCPDLIVLPPDPWKYRYIHLKLRKLISCYTDDFFPKSIDEFVANLDKYLLLKEKTLKSFTPESSKKVSEMMFEIGWELKKRIKKEIGEWLTVSIGFAPNRYLAKLASGLKKPDGLQEINKENFLSVYSKLSLMELPYIKIQNSARLNSVGIFTVLDFYKASFLKLRAAFKSINAYYWYIRLRGYEIDDVSFSRRSYGNSYALPKPLTKLKDLSPILAKLVEKTCSRLRKAGYKAKGVHVSILYSNNRIWHKGMTFSTELFDSRDIYKKAYGLLCDSGCRMPVRNLAVSCFNLIKYPGFQLHLFEDVQKKKNLVESIDFVNRRWGDFVLTSAKVLEAKNLIPDRIAFGGVKELEEFSLDVI